MPEAHQPVDHRAEHPRDHERIGQHREAAHRLPAELGGSAAVQDAGDVRRRGAAGKQADAERPHQPADQVDADHVERVVVGPAVLQPDRDRTDDAGDQAERERAQRGDGAAAGRDRDQPGHHPGRGAERGGMAVAQPLDREPAARTCRAGDQGRGEDVGGGLVGTERGAGVEPEPAHPQQARAEHHQGQVVRPHRVHPEADPAAEHERQREPGGAGADLHRGTAGEVDQMQPVDQPAAGMTRVRGVEDPVRDRRVDQHRPGGDEDHPGAEPGPVGDRAGDQCAGDHREQALEAGEQDHRHVQPAAVAGDECLQADQPSRYADQPAPGVVAEGQPVADHHPHDRDHAQCGERHHHHVQHALGAHHPAVEQRQAGDHQQHQRRRGEQPGRVTGVDHEREWSGRHGPTFPGRCFAGWRAVLRPC
jgi:hypothetical protein